MAPFFSGHGVYDTLADSIKSPHKLSILCYWIQKLWMRQSVKTVMTMHCTKHIVRNWVTLVEFYVVCPTWHMIGHVGDEPFQAINCTGTDNRKHRNEITCAPQTHKKKHRNKKTCRSSSHKTTKPWFSRVSQYLARKWTGAILTTSEPDMGPHTERKKYWQWDIGSELLVTLDKQQK